jgi:hypothetical protein
VRVWVVLTVLQEICESNGINEEQLVHRADEVSTIEMFLFNFGKVRSAVVSRLLYTGD